MLNNLVMSELPKKRKLWELTKEINQTQNRNDIYLEQLRQELLQQQKQQKEAYEQMLCFDKRVDILKFEDQSMLQLELEAKEQEWVWIEEELKEDSEQRKWKYFKYRLWR